MRKRKTKPFDIISRAWQITWENKTLWVFGFFAGLYIGNNNYNNFHVQGGAWFFQNIGGVFSTNALITILMIVSALIFWVISTSARISLIQEVSSLSERKPKPIRQFKESFRLSLNPLMRILAMQSFVLLPIFLISLMSYFFTESGISDLQNSVNEANFFGYFGGALLLGLGALLITIPLLFLDAFAFREIVLNKLGVKDGIKNAIQIIKANLKPIFQLSAAIAILGSIFAFVVGLLLSPFLLFILNSIMGNVSQCATFQGDFQAMENCIKQIGTNPSVVAVNIIANIISAAIYSIWVTLQSTSFTLAYKKFTE